MIRRRLVTVLGAAVLAGAVLAAEKPALHATRADRAAALLRTRGDKLHRLMPLLLSYLARRFPDATDWSWVRGQVDRTLAFTRSPQGEAAAPYARLLDAGATLPRRPEDLVDNEIDRLTAPALWCDRFPMSVADFDTALRTAARTGGYDLTHAALAFEWARENGCLPAGQTEKTRAMLVARLRALIATGKTDDVQVEAGAMLDYLGERPPPALVERLRNTQRVDGGWPAVARGDSDDHTTTLALWVLLATEKPGARSTWIPR